MPSYARIPRTALERVRQELLADGEDAQERLDDAFDRFEDMQPALSDYIGSILERPSSDAATALGFFLSLSIWMAFDHYHGHSLREVGEDELHSTRELLTLDGVIREAEPADPLETVDVIGMEQPALVEFVHEHVNATLDFREGTVEADELQLVYRMVLVEVLALSYAVKMPAGFPVSKAEVLA